MRLLDYANKTLTAEMPYPNAKRLPNVFYPTDASVVVNLKGENVMFGKCARAVYMRMMGYKKTSPKKERSERIFGYGKYFERNEIDIYKRAGIYVANNVKFSMQIPNSDSFVSGEADAIVQANGKYIGVEFKTSYGNNFLRQNVIGYKRKGKFTGLNYVFDDLLPAPKIEHIMQVMLYLDFYSNSIDEFHIVYSARDSMAMAEYKLWLDQRADGKKYVKVEKLEDNEKAIPIPIVDLSTQDIYDRFLYIRRHIINGTMPHPDYDVLGKSDWQCGYCDYREACLNTLPADMKVNAGKESKI